MVSSSGFIMQASISVGLLSQPSSCLTRCAPKPILCFISLLSVDVMLGVA